MEKGEAMAEKVTLTIDGKKITADASMTILEAARQNGINIPALCYDPLLAPLENCRLCIVSIEGEEQFKASCGTLVKEGMNVVTNSDEIKATRKLLLDMLLDDHYGDCVPPCQQTCPAHIDIQGYIALIREGQYLEAVKLIKERNPMPATIGRVCPHTCEFACRRNLVDEALAINPLKRFASDVERKSGTRILPTVPEESGKKVAIIGGGPAGLSAAYYLRSLGHGATIFESLDKLGGMLRYGIPEYRLPKAILDWEIDGILSLGVEVHTGKKWGKDFTIEDLKKQGFDAIFIGIGAWAVRKLGVEGEDLDGVISGVTFLKDVAAGKDVKVADRVAIIGGGNVAIDAARTCLRMGAKEVTIVYRRSRKEMPANPEEIDAAEHEGIKMHFLAAPVKLHGENGKLKKLEFVRMELGEPDASGRRRPIPIEGSETMIDVDQLITAIGQFPDLLTPEEDKYMEKLGITRWKTFEADPDTMYTGKEGIFVGGDIYHGPLTVITALADGRKAAYAIDKYFKGEDLKPPKEEFNISRGSFETIDKSIFEGIPKQERQKMSELEVAERVKTFAEVELGLTEEQALEEAKRCLLCGCGAAYDCQFRKLLTEYEVESREQTKPRVDYNSLEELNTSEFIVVDPNKCIRCQRCVTVCTYYECVGAIDFTDWPTVNEKCIACGLCLDICPTGALLEKIEGRVVDRIRWDEIRGVCTHCACGCSLIFQTKGNRIMWVKGNDKDAFDRNYTCKQGRFRSFDYLWKKDRLENPMIRKGKRLTKVEWDAALDWIVENLQKIQEKRVKDGFAVIGSTAFSNEANYLLQRFARNVLETNNIDAVGLNSYSDVVDMLGESLGVYGMPQPLSSLEEAAAAFVVGDVEECAPIVATALRRLSNHHGKELILANHKDDSLKQYADRLLNIKKGKAVDLVNGLTSIILSEELYDTSFLEKNTTGLDKLKKEVAKFTIETVEKETGVSADVLVDIARLLAKVPDVSFVLPLDYMEKFENISLWKAVFNLALVTGNIGQKAGGIFPLPAYANSQGALDMGLSPKYYPGYVTLSQVDTLKDVYGSSVPKKTGLRLDKILENAKKGKIKALYVFGSPYFTQTIKELSTALKKVDFLIVQSPFPTHASKAASAILPCSALLEENGTITSMERRLSKLNIACASPGKARPDWEIVAEIMAKMGGPKYETLEDVQSEISKVVNFYGSMDPDILEGKPYWPFSSKDKAGKAYFELKDFNKPISFLL
ncbi:MAG: hypothetical protein DRG59_00310 [Deltaproteobacteria bacterium]|nr:MAG: hypothetical protein DRG59_00310 [Deltaproteobacteria bacterium]